MSILLSDMRDDRQLRALTGLSEEQYERLARAFGEVHEEMSEKAYEDAVSGGRRKRKRGGGRRGRLATVREKLLSVLYCLKNYPTFDVLSAIFGMSRSKACENLHKLMPVLNETLIRIGAMPRRQFENADDMREALGDVDKIIIDATERAHRRPSDSEMQASMYSGKKKAHGEKHHHELRRQGYIVRWSDIHRSQS